MYLHFAFIFVYSICKFRFRIFQCFDLIATISFPFYEATDYVSLLEKYFLSKPVNCCRADKVGSCDIPSSESESCASRSHRSCSTQTQQQCIVPEFTK